jgi:hypothetical protein
MKFLILLVQLSDEVCHQSFDEIHLIVHVIGLIHIHVFLNKEKRS